MKYFIMLLFFVSFLTANATTTEQYNFEISSSQGPESINPSTCQVAAGSQNGVYSESVEYIPGKSGHWKVICQGVGIIYCDFDCANEPVDPRPDLYYIANGHSFLSYAMTQIKDTTLTGNYSNNISNSNGYFLRTIQWSSTSDMSTINIQINITKTQIPF